MKVEKECEACQKKYIPYNSHQRFCCETCTRSHIKKIHTKGGYAEKACAKCKIIYKPSNNTSKFCSASCKSKNFYDKKNEKWFVEKKPHKPSEETRDKFDQAHVYAYDKAWMKKFKACRG